MSRPVAAWLRRTSRRPSSRALAAGFTLLVAAGLAACGGSAIPVTSFDPASACTTDGRQPGAYPDLEALLPTDYDGRAPDNVDSGRNCTAAALGSLEQDGVDGVRFAGATWSLGGTSALTVAVFDGTGLDAAKLLAFYEAGARVDRHTEEVSTADTTVGGKAGRRLDVLASDGTGHTVVTWPGDQPGRVNVLLASDLGDSRVVEELASLGAR